LNKDAAELKEAKGVDLETATLAHGEAKEAYDDAQAEYTDAKDAYSQMHGMFLVYAEQLKSLDKGTSPLVHCQLNSTQTQTQTPSSNSCLSTLHTSWHPTLQQLLFIDHNRKFFSCWHHRANIFVFV
jgi:hypothetical protein